MDRSTCARSNPGVATTGRRPSQQHWSVELARRIWVMHMSVSATMTRELQTGRETALVRDQMVQCSVVVRTVDCRITYLGVGIHSTLPLFIHLYT